MKGYKSKIHAAIHESVSDLRDAGVVDARTMRRFDESCLTPVRPFTPTEIRALREREMLSQAVLARYLNVTTSLVSQWERGERHPAGPSLKLLSLLQSKGLEAIA